MSKTHNTAPTTPAENEEFLNKYNFEKTVEDQDSEPKSAEEAFGFPSLDDLDSAMDEWAAKEAEYLSNQPDALREQMSVIDGKMNLIRNNPVRIEDDPQVKAAMIDARGHVDKLTMQKNEHLASVESTHRDRVKSGKRIKKLTLGLFGKGRIRKAGEKLAHEKARLEYAFHQPLEAAKTNEYAIQSDAENQTRATQRAELSAHLTEREKLEKKLFNPVGNLDQYQANKTYENELAVITEKTSDDYRELVPTINAEKATAVDAVKRSQEYQDLAGNHLEQYNLIDAAERVIQAKYQAQLDAIQTRASAAQQQALLVRLKGPYSPTKVNDRSKNNGATISEAAKAAIRIRESVDSPINSEGLEQLLAELKEAA